MARNEGTAPRRNLVNPAFVLSPISTEISQDRSTKFGLAEAKSHGRFPRRVRKPLARAPCRLLRANDRVPPAPHSTTLDTTRHVIVCSSDVLALVSLSGSLRAIT